jgi:hypothetical protein
MKNSSAQLSLGASARRDALFAPSSLERQRYGVPLILISPVNFEILFFEQPKPWPSVGGTLRLSDGIVVYQGHGSGG